MLTKYAILLIVISLLTFIVYGVDKARAIKRAWRIPEKVLLGLSFFCGAYGGFLGMQVFRHKTRRWYFYLVNLIGIAWQTALLVYLIYNPGFLG